jgi:hypothetical protein
MCGVNTSGRSSSLSGRSIALEKLGLRDAGPLSLEEPQPSRASFSLKHHGDLCARVAGSTHGPLTSVVAPLFDREHGLRITNDTNASSISLAKSSGAAQTPAESQETNAVAARPQPSVVDLDPLCSLSGEKASTPQAQRSWSQEKLVWEDLIQRAKLGKCTTEPPTGPASVSSPVHFSPPPQKDSPPWGPQPPEQRHCPMRSSSLVHPTVSMQRSLSCSSITSQAKASSAQAIHMNQGVHLLHPSL